MTAIINITALAVIAAVVILCILLRKHSSPPDDDRPEMYITMEDNDISEKTARNTLRRAA